MAIGPVTLKMATRATISALKDEEARRKVLMIALAYTFRFLHPAVLRAHFHPLWLDEIVEADLTVAEFVHLIIPKQHY